MLVWRLPGPLLAISSAPLGGGIGRRDWVVNATVDLAYRRDDPEVHLASLADDLGLTGVGVGLLTAVDVAEVIRTGDEGVVVWSTVGLGSPQVRHILQQHQRPPTIWQPGGGYLHPESRRARASRRVPSPRPAAYLVPRDVKELLRCVRNSSEAASTASEAARAFATL